jgi:hypothetical protein
VDENALFELSDGRIVAICRGDNTMFPETPGRKWLSFSDNDGESWLPPVPLPADDGSVPESGSNGSALFRSIKTGKLYWIGNLCLAGQRARGNLPRTSLALIEVQEAPFALRLATMFLIDEKGYNDSPDLELSNFRFYQDRLTGDLVLLMNRYEQHGHDQWWNSDYYRYRIEIE